MNFKRMQLPAIGSILSLAVLGGSQGCSSAARTLAEQAGESVAPEDAGDGVPEADAATKGIEARTARDGSAPHRDGASTASDASVEGGSPDAGPTPAMPIISFGAPAY